MLDSGVEGRSKSAAVATLHGFGVPRDPGTIAKGETGYPTAAGVRQSGEVCFAILLALAHLTAPTRAFKTAYAD